jgi:hypothetical protein
MPTMRMRRKKRSYANYARKQKRPCAASSASRPSARSAKAACTSQRRWLDIIVTKSDRHHLPLLSPLRPRLLQLQSKLLRPHPLRHQLLPPPLQPPLHPSQPPHQSPHRRSRRSKRKSSSNPGRPRRTMRTRHRRDRLSERCQPAPQLSPSAIVRAPVVHARASPLAVQCRPAP